MINYIGYFASAITGVFLLSFVGRVYGVAEVGYLGVWTSIYFIAVQLGVFGLHNAITGLSQKQKVYDFPRSRRLLFSALLLVAVNGTVLLVVGYGLASLVPDSGDLGFAFFITLTASVFPSSMNKLFFSFYSIGGSPHIVGWFSVVRSVGMVVYAVLMYLFSAPFEVFLFVLFFAECGGLLFYVLNYRPFARKFGEGPGGQKGRRIGKFGPVVRILMRFSAPAMFSNLVYEINTRVDILVCSLFVSEVALALYTLVVSLIEGFLGLAIISKTLLLPKLRDALRTDIGGFVRYMALRLTLAMAVLAVPVYVVGNYYVIFTGATMTPAAHLSFLILLTCVIVVSWTIPLHNLFFLLKRPGTFSRFVFLSAVVNVLLNFALIPWLGILGAAIATALSMLFLAFCVVVRLYFLAMPGSRKV